jgi:hypothetical protein
MLHQQEPETSVDTTINRPDDVVIQPIEVSGSKQLEPVSQGHEVATTVVSTKTPTDIEETDVKDTDNGASDVDGDDVAKTSTPVKNSAHVNKVSSRAHYNTLYCCRLYHNMQC